MSRTDDSWHHGNGGKNAVPGVNNNHVLCTVSSKESKGQGMNRSDPHKPGKKT